MASQHNADPGSDQRFMREALRLAEHAAGDGEVPVGAVLVIDGSIIASGANRTITDTDPTAHAEVVAIRAAAAAVANHRTGGEMFVTLEPCAMCMGALLQARVTRLVYAAADPKAGAARSLYQLGDDERLNHRIAVEEGPCGPESAELLRGFFRARRG